jgi:hypothetical protein
VALLNLREAGAIRTFGDVDAKTPALLAAQSTVRCLRDGELRLRARELVVQLLGKRFASAEEESLERGCRRPRISAISL